MLRTAFVGTGWWGAELARAAAALPEAIRIAGFFSLSDEECRRLSDRHGGIVFVSLEQLLASADVDALVLATPHSQHAPQVVAAAVAGKHVFVEKPLALEVESARRAAQACESAGRVLAVGHNRRFTPGARKMRELLARCGQILHVEAHYSGDMMMRLPAQHWRVQRPEMPAAGMAPMGLHMIDTLQWLLGPLARIAAICKRQAIGHDLDDTSAALFELESGATGVIASLLACPLSADLRLYGTAANLEARGNFSSVMLRTSDGQTETFEFKTDESLAQELRAFAAACAGREPYPVKTQEAIRNVAVMQAMVASSEAGGAWIKL